MAFFLALWPVQGKSDFARLKLRVLERWMSGLSHTPGKRARGQTLRGFESPLLRQIV
jgi:hypothetical protein